MKRLTKVLYLNLPKSVNFNTTQLDFLVFNCNASKLYTYIDLQVIEICNIKCHKNPTQLNSSLPQIYPIIYNATRRSSIVFK